ncbi:MAG: hypothetical protein KGH94_04385 [Candidatus Micrarchaeota archaeon]|nr:hypothetical protein [Candidatus Micrarchaeota archaeon]
MGRKNRAQRQREREFEILRRGSKVKWDDMEPIPYPNGKLHVWVQGATPDGKDHYQAITKDFLAEHRPPKRFTNKIQKALRREELREERVE